MSPADTAMKKFEQNFLKAFGENTLRKAADLPSYEVISTGSLELDYAMGCGGYIVGRLTELWGAYGTGKTTLALIAAAEAQRAYSDMLVGLIDVEQTFDPNWAALHGVDLDRLRVIQVNSAEDVADAMKMLIECDLFKMVILDSIGAMLPQKEAEKDAEEVVVGLGAKVITRMVKLATGRAQQHRVAVLLINQIRDSIGAYVGPATTRPGGHAAQHCTTHVLKPRRTSEPPYVLGEKGNSVQVGHQIAVTVDKNKVAPPKRTAFITMFNQPTEKYGPPGIDRAFEALSMGKRLGVIERTGAWYTLPDESRHQGEESVREYLRTRPEVITVIRDRVLASVAHEVVTDPMKEG